MLTASTAAIAAYCETMVRSFAPASAAGGVLARWLRWQQWLVGIDFDAAISRRPTPRRRRKTTTDRPLSNRNWQGLRGALAKAATTGAQTTDTIAANIAVFARAAGLDALEADIFRFVYHTDREKAFGELCSDLVATRSIDSLGLAALVLDRRPAEIWQRLSRGALNAMHLVNAPGDSVARFTFYVPYRVVNALLPPSDGIADIERRLIGAPLRPALSCGDFAHVAAERDFVLRLLRGATEMQRSGVNILVYGPPGTGKSEFCKMAAAELGCDLFAVGETDEDGDEPKRRDRIDALRLAERLTGRRGNVLLLFDEMEDVLQSGDRVGRHMRRAGSKVFFNRLLEHNRVPVLWTANGIDEFDPAFLRRMSFAFELKTPSAATRARLWEGLAQRQGLTVPPAQAIALARRHNVSPSVMKGAAQAVSIARGTADEIDFVVKALARPIGGLPRPETSGPVGFAPDLVNADADLAELERALTRPAAPRDVSLCLYGPPGTGKSGFARHLAEAMGLEPLVKRGSDLLSKWVGGTERRIAEAFEEALQDQRFLIIDEAEGLLWQRSGASRSWEVSMVNELLCAMEAHPLPFACTTNHLDAIDPAAIRRFSFKVKFDFLTPDQTGAAYRRFFGREPPAALRRLVSLTPGDFAVVAKQRRILGAMAGSDEDLPRLLELEVAAKNLARRIGY
jgi:transitional endoplasmic reticulum ATPase